MESLKNILLCVLICLFLSFTFIFNSSGQEFYKMSFHNIIGYILQIINITLMYYIYISFAKQFSKDQKKIKIFEDNLDSLLFLIKDEEIKGNFKSNSKDILTLKIRRINNLIDRLKMVEKKIFDTTDVEYIEAKFNKYSQIIGEEISNLDNLNLNPKKLSLITKNLYNIEQKCELLKLKIFDD